MRNPTISMRSLTRFSGLGAAGIGQEVLGYSLLGRNPLRLIVFLLGPTSSGKTTLAALLQAAIGDYAQTFNMTVFRDNRDERPRTDLADALPARVILADEASAAWVLHADQVKKLTGGAPINVRRNFAKSGWSAVPEFTPMIATNHPPKISGADPAFNERLMVLPFEKTLPLAQRDANEKDRLVALPEVREAMLAWLVDGYARYAARGSLAEAPVEVLLAKERFNAGITATNEFVAMCCELGEVDDLAYESVTLELYDVFRAWHKKYADDEKIISLTAFSMALDSMSGIE